jgi:multiple sugar transport system substrate-binding protein
LKKLLSLTLVLLLMLTGLSVSASAQGYGEISFMGWGDEAEHGLYQAVIDKFVAENPGTTVNYIYTPDDYSTKLQTMIAGNTIPDLFWVVDSEITTYAMSGILEDMKPYMDAHPEILADYLPSLLEYGSYNGGLYALPKDWASIVMYVNLDMFAAAGLEAPSNNWTLDQYRAAAKAMTIVKDGRTEQYGAALTVYRADWMSLGASFGAQWFKDGKSNFMDPKMVSTVTFMNDMFNTDKSAPSPAGVSSMGTAQNQLFETGKVGILLSGRWETPAYRNSCTFKWDVREVPQGVNGEHGIPVITGALAVGKDSKNKDGAYALLQYLLSYDAQKSVLGGGLSMPSFTKMMSDPAIVTTPPSAEPFINSASYLGIQSQREALATGKYAKFQSIIHAEMEICFNGEQTPEQACQNIDDKANAELFS